MFVRILTALLVIGLAGFCLADPGESSEEFVVPSEFCRGYVLIPITLNKHVNNPDGGVLWFLYDTGASDPYIDPESVERASGVKVKVGQKAIIRDASAGPVTFNKLRARVINLDHLSRAIGREIDGILSFTTFRDYLLTIDYQHNELRLSKGKLPKPDGKTIFSAKGKDSRPWFEVEFPNQKRRMLIDSGAATTDLALNKLGRIETLSDPIVVGASFRLKKVEMRSAARASGDVRIGPHVLLQPTLQSVPGTELIGGKVMRHFNWTFDQKNKRVRIHRNEPQTPITFDPVITHGMVLVMHPGGFEIESIIPDTPAAQTNLRQGDVVTHWNGLPLGEQGCAEDDVDQRLLTVTVLRDEITHEVEIALFPMVE